MGHVSCGNPECAACHPPSAKEARFHGLTEDDALKLWVELQEWLEERGKSRENANF